MNDGQLRWRCRRGMKELDVLLGRWITQRHHGASSDQRAAFERFLDLPDPDMARYLLGREQPPAEHSAVLQELLDLAKPATAGVAPRPASDPQR